jgi:hypothetical protein
LRFDIERDAPVLQAAAHFGALTVRETLDASTLARRQLRVELGGAVAARLRAILHQRH